jgi:hypothetical protein
MSRLQSSLRSWEDGARENRLNGYDTTYEKSWERRMAIISEMQQRYDHLAGVPKRGDDD